MLTAVVFLPLAGALIIALILRGDKLVRWFAVAVTVADLALAGVVFGMYFQDKEGFRLVEQHTWIKPLNIQYLMAVDGLSAPLVLLTGLLGMSAAFASWGIQTRLREYFCLASGAPDSGDGGVRLSGLRPVLHLLGVGAPADVHAHLHLGTGRKEYSAMKFLIFTVSGSAFMLVGLLVLYFSTGTFDMRELPEQIDLAGKLLVPAATVFFAFFVAFSIKLPVWPVHTWLPDAHTDAPTAVSVMLAGVLLKMGGYGLIRICVTMFPKVTQDYAWLLVTLAVVSILYGAMITLRQTDLKRLIAYSSVSHMGFVMLGISSVGSVAGGVSPHWLNGAAMQMFTHGTITGLLFVVAGLIYERTHTRHILT